MLYVYYGTDEKRTRSAVRKAIEALRKRAPEAHYARFTAEDAEKVDFEELLFGQGLFYTKHIIFFDGAMESDVLKKTILSHVKELAAAEHVFFILEKKLLAAEVKKLLGKAQKMEQFDSKEHKKTERGNDFELANLLQERDRAKMWVSYRRALARGAAPEALHGMLFWKAKDMILKKNSRAFTDEEAKKLVARLSELPYDARRRGEEMELALERFILAL